MEMLPFQKVRGFWGSRKIEHGQSLNSPAKSLIMNVSKDRLLFSNYSKPP